MKVIGVTGGVGSGKSALLAYVKEKYNCRVLLADEAAHKLREPGGACYEKLAAILPGSVLDEDGSINKSRMAAEIFRSGELLAAVNAVIHPAVKEYILGEIATERERGAASFFFLEAALLIENGYPELVDEMWYIYAAEDVRRQRLSRSRNYSEEKINGIMRSQLSEGEFRKHCSTVIDNTGGFEDACRQIDVKLGEYL